MDLKIQELKSDVAELESLQKQATRQRIKDLITIEIRKLLTEIAKLQEELNTTGSEVSAPKVSRSNPEQRYQVKLSNYAWDQTGKFVKFYVTLKNVHTLPQENVFCNFEEKSLEMHVKNLENKDYYFVITNLLNKIKVDECSWKIKSDMVIISIAKSEPQNWSHVTELEKKASDAQKLDQPDEKTDDPSAGIMNLMKKMYDSGDDEMKRTIAKAWTESQDKMHRGGV